jgi:hypothetical protein
MTHDSSWQKTHGIAMCCRCRPRAIAFYRVIYLTCESVTLLTKTQISNSFFALVEPTQAANRRSYVARRRSPRILEWVYVPTWHPFEQNVLTTSDKWRCSSVIREKIGWISAYTLRRPLGVCKITWEEGREKGCPAGLRKSLAWVAWIHEWLEWNT